MQTSRLRVRHQLPHRLRIDFGEQLSRERLRSLIWHLERQHPGALIRVASSGQGLVMASRNPVDPLSDPLRSLEALLAQQLTPIPEPLPTAWQAFMSRSLHRSRNLLIALAIAGWVLPILPGTPFFLLAWWMGWRPEPKEGAADTPDGEEGARGGELDHCRGGDQPKSITSQGDSSRADRQTS